MARAARKLSAARRKRAEQERREKTFAAARDWIASVRAYTQALYEEASSIAHEVRTNPDGLVAEAFGFSRDAIMQLACGLDAADNAAMSVQPHIDLKLPDPIAAARR